MKKEKNFLYLSIETAIFIIAMGLVCLLTIKAINTNKQNLLSEKVYKSEELKIGNISTQSSVEDVLNSLGNPESQNEFVDEATGDKVLEYTYSNGATIVNFRDKNDGKGYCITYMQTSDEKYALPKNLKIGDSKETVLNSFNESCLVKDGALSEDTLKFGPENNASVTSEGIIFWIQDGVVVSAAMVSQKY